MIIEYVEKAMEKATFEDLGNTEGFYGEIPGFDGVLSNAPAESECREQLREVLEEWILLRVSRQLPIPVVDGIELRIQEVG